MVPPELKDRLPSALQEINRKITAQNIIWLALQTERTVSSVSINKEGNEGSFMTSFDLVLIEETLRTKRG